MKCEGIIFEPLKGAKLIIEVQGHHCPLKSDNFCNRKVGRTITIWREKEKISILVSQYWKNY